MHLFSRFQFRDWLLANDPALSRLRMASRVTLTIVLVFLILLAIEAFILPLPTAAFGLGIVLSIEGGVAVRDKGNARQLVTRLFGCAVSLVVVAIAAGLEDQRVLSDLVFLVIILLASAGRVFGPRGFAIGMFAFTSYFMGAYFQPPLAELPEVAIGPVVSVLVGHVVRAVLLPDDWRRDLLRSLESVSGRINQILFKLAALAASGDIGDADRQELRQLEDRLKEVVLMAETFIPRPSAGVFDGASNPAAELAIRLFDAHLAAESAIVLSFQSPPPFALVHAVIEADAAELERYEGTTEAIKDQPQGETIRALLWLGEARRQLTEAINTGRASGFSGIDAAKETAQAQAIDFSLANPLLRSALQITLASAIAMGFGLLLSRERWFWAVLASFLVFTNTNSRGDTAMKALSRSLGTVFGIAMGLVLATLISGEPDIAIPVMAICIFLAFYFLQVSYATMTFFISIVLCLVYGMTGVLTLDLLKLRIGETVIGAAAGTAVAFVVFPARTRGALDAALARWFQALRELLGAIGEGKGGFELIALSQKIDACYRDVTVAARPLGSSWSVVTRPGQIRRTLAIFLSCTYWARVLARSYEAPPAGSDQKRLIAADVALIDDAAPRGASCFFIERKASRTTGRHLPVSREGARVGLEMIGSALERLYPQADTLPFASGEAIARSKQG
ncbi:MULTISPECIES: FUSC family protein [Rhizobium]|uniref:FUSC family protein n=1 Tax=Rhizobium TaxID=379 RepID=UPI0007EB2D59|nr:MULTISPECIES: FUSC family protein [Rhizobium]ANK91874.1 fusaric acid resistance-like protein [Rhizobium sp. N6212]ANK97908.1 fusaric acid resistance-like protein [Rhizobium sp. N621]ANL03987.1 fusaric acid resistance-like protein [Rhizobium esperanzae]ANL10033.1 fusaric acid resistance-like protein [Rhizobium sp. N1341]ANL22085.1 fusaric acid resistance-like protein [Rhizobium sp. N113]